MEACPLAPREPNVTRATAAASPSLCVCVPRTRGRTREEAAMSCGRLRKRKVAPDVF